MKPAPTLEEIIKWQEERITKLEKENEELKQRLFEMQNANIDLVKQSEVNNITDDEIRKIERLCTSEVEEMSPSGTWGKTYLFFDKYKFARAILRKAQEK